jgi:beta-lactam-binding protein with PASTA domain
VERISEDSAVIAKLKVDGFIPLDKEKTVSEQETIKDLSEMNVSELKELAKQKGLTGYTSLTKDQLLEALKDVV